MELGARKENVDCGKGKGRLRVSTDFHRIVQNARKTGEGPGATSTWQGIVEVLKFLAYILWRLSGLQSYDIVSAHKCTDTSAYLAY